MASFREVGIPDAGSKLLELRPLFPTSENFLMHSAARQTSHVSILQTCFFICSFVTPAVCKKMYVVPYYLTSPPPPPKKNPKNLNPPKQPKARTVIKYSGVSSGLINIFSLLCPQRILASSVFSL